MPEWLPARSPAHQVDRLKLLPRLIALARSDEREAPRVHLCRGPPLVMRARRHRLERPRHAMRSNQMLRTQLPEHLHPPVKQVERVVDAELKPVEALRITTK